MFPKLSESFILNEIVELLKKGHDVQIFSMHVPCEDVMHEEIKKYRLLERTYYGAKVKIYSLNGYQSIKTLN